MTPDEARARITKQRERTVHAVMNRPRRAATETAKLEAMERRFADMFGEIA